MFLHKVFIEMLVDLGIGELDTVYKHTGDPGAMFV